MKNFSLTLLISFLFINFSFAQDWNLVWSDEFESEGAINSENWFQQTQLPNGLSWYNGELQHYTDRIENSFVEGGVLKIAAIKEPFTDQGQTKEYTSARLNSKITYKYGRIEIRAKLPFGQGTWPAIWTLGKNIAEPGAYWYNEGFGTTSWPACGEIDIMEHWGSNQNFTQSATHTPSSFGGTVNHGGQVIQTASSEFHVYAMEWTEEELVFSVDDVVHYTYNPPVKNSSTWPFDEEQYLVLNIAIEGGISPYFVQSSLQIDYVRLYCEDGNCVDIPVDPCEGITCDEGQTCEDGNCVDIPVDPCEGITCEEGQTCEDGVCVNPDTGIVFSADFGGTFYDSNTYTNPTGSEEWAGFANQDVSLYPFSFSDGGEITFTGATDGTDVDLYFRFERLPHPNVDPSFNTAAVTVSGTDEASYSVAIPAQDAANTYSSFLLYVTTADAAVTLTDVAVASGSTIGINNYEINELSIFPNPANSQWTIHSENTDITLVEVFDLQGKLVLTLSPDSPTVEINASNLVKGVYLSKISTDSGTSTVRLVKI